jgi:uncharacterized protein
MSSEERHMSAFEARTHLGEMLDYIRYSKAPCFIERYGKRVAAILDMDSYEILRRPHQYQEWVDEAVDKIVKTCQPQKIILFGSVAKSRMHEGSDIDLLIIMATKKRRIERIQEIFACVPEAIPIEPHVYTPTELRVALKDKDPFLEEITRSGMILYEGQK